MMFNESLSRSQATEFIQRCYDRDALLDALLSFSTNLLHASIVALILKDKLQIQRGAGAWRGASSQTILNNKALQDIFQAQAPALQDPVSLGLIGLAHAIIDNPPDTLLVVPLLLAKRPVIALIGAPQREDAPLQSFESLFEMTSLVAAQLQEIIVMAKAGTLPPPEERIPKLPEILRPTPTHDDDDQLLGFSSASEPYPAALAQRHDHLPNPEHRHLSMHVGQTSEGLIDESLLRTLPRTPFDESSSVSEPAQRPPRPRHDRSVKLTPSASPSMTQPHQPVRYNPRQLAALFNRDETSGVSILVPKSIDEVRESTSRTLMGGFSVADLTRARQEAEQQEAQERAATKQTLSGVSAVSIAHHPPQPAAPAARVIKPTRRRDESLAQEEPPPTPKRRPREAPQPAQSATNTATPRPAAPPTPSLALSIEALSIELQSRDVKSISAAIPKLLTHPDGAQIIEQHFPGRLSIDRYQYTAETLPPVEEHSALLASLVAVRDGLTPLLSRLLRSTSLDTRFYATHLLTKLDALPLLRELRERLFDRDLQTRTLARHILLNLRHESAFEEHVVAPLRAQLYQSPDEHQLDTITELLALAHDRESVPKLIELLDQQRGRQQQSILHALQRITLQPLDAASFAWRAWWKMGKNEPRIEWILRALNASSASIRELVAQEIMRYPELGLNYQPNHPPSMRIRAQQQLRAALDADPTLINRL